MQSQLGRTQPLPREGTDYQQFVRELQGQQEASLEFLKGRIAMAEKKLEEEKDQLRRDRLTLVQREAALKDEVEKEKAGILKDLDRVIEAEKRVHAQSVQL